MVVTYVILLVCIVTEAEEFWTFKVVICGKYEYMDNINIKFSARKLADFLFLLVSTVQIIKCANSCSKRCFIRNGQTLIHCKPILKYTII